MNGILVVQTPQLIAVLCEAAPCSTYRLIFTDGRPHPDPDGLEPSFWGHSIGRWEGNTLVVDTVGLTEESWVGGGGATGRNMYTSIHSDKLHVIERWTRDGDVLTNDVVVEDPVAFSKPWVIGPRRVRHASPDDVICESICKPTPKEHFVPPDPSDPDIKSRCGYRCESDEPDPNAAPPAAVITGNWDVTIKYGPGGQRTLEHPAEGERAHGQSVRRAWRAASVRFNRGSVRPRHRERRRQGL